MSQTIKLKRGFDILIAGSAGKILAEAGIPGKYGIKPIDYPGLTPKLIVKPGDRVLGGSPLFHNKVRPEITFNSPVSGTVISVERGERRKILEIIVEKSGEEYIDFGKADPAKLSRNEIIAKLLASGLWPAVRQRPYNVVARPDQKPKSIFISGFDSSPLAPDYNFITENTPSSFIRTGFNAVSRLTEGKVNLVLNGKAPALPVLTGIPGIEISYFSGPHPAGNPGIHIHHLDPLNKGEIVWVINLQDIFAIGRLFEEGIYKPERIIALTGSEVLKAQYYRILAGASVSGVVNENVREGNLRFISGNVLTGTRIAPDGYLGFYDSQVTVIPEGDHYDFLGWAVPGLNRFSFSRTFVSTLLPKQNYRLDTNLNGGERAFVMTGVYEKVVPMDIYPMLLLKAIIAGDIESMENLGIYEIAEEDFALCEYVCPSKIEIQSIVRTGLDLMIKEMN